MDGELEEDSKGDSKGDSGQVRSRSGLVQVWFSLQPKFYSFELDSEVGRLVIIGFTTVLMTEFMTVFMTAIIFYLNMKNCPVISLSLSTWTLDTFLTIRGFPTKTL